MKVYLLIHVTRIVFNTTCKNKLNLNLYLLREDYTTDLAKNLNARTDMSSDNKLNPLVTPRSL